MPAMWPFSLPTGFLAETDREIYENNLLVTSMDMGPAKTRRRTTAGAGTLEGTILITAAQKATFDAFWRSTLRSGALAFTFTDRILRFKQPPEAHAVRTSEGLHYEVSLVLEVLP